MVVGGGGPPRPLPGRFCVLPCKGGGPTRPAATFGGGPTALGCRCEAVTPRRCCPLPLVGGDGRGLVAIGGGPPPNPLPLVGGEGRGRDDNRGWLLPLGGGPPPLDPPPPLGCGGGARGGGRFDIVVAIAACKKI